MLATYFRAISAVTNKKHAIILLFGSVVFVLLSLLEPVFFREIIDVLVGFGSGASESFSSLFRVLLWWGLVGLLLLIVQGMVSLGADRMAHHSFHALRRRFFDHVLQLAMRFHGDTHSGKSLKIFTRGSDAFFWIQLEFYRKNVPNLLTIIFLLPLCLVLNWRLGLVLIVCVLLFLVVAVPVMIRTNQRQFFVEEFYSEASAHVGDAFGNVAIVKSFTRLADEMQRFRANERSSLSVQLPLLNWWALLIMLARIINTLIFISIFCLGSYLFFLQLTTIGEIVMFIGFASLLLNALETLLWQAVDVFWRYHGVKEFFEILDEQKEIVDKPHAAVLPRVQGKVVFENVGFAYDDNRNALDALSFEAKPGETIALVGHTGAGKSTIAHLISRFFDVTSGKILIDGVDIRDVTQDSLRENVGMVFQENFLFHDSVLQNICIGKPDATETEVIAAAKKARAWDFISILPEGLQTIVGERGVKLSGGERQRIAIARVILKNPPILVLDEATSALDSVTEKKLQEALNILMEGRTTLIIAHRLSTIRKADKIIVLQHGKIIEEGSYSHLISKKGEFAKMVEVQTAGFLV